MPTIDCFITTNRKRPYFEYLTWCSLMDNGFEPDFIEEPMLERYFACERHAMSDLYILSDDDVIPATSDTLKQLVTLMQKHPDLSQLGLAWKPNLSKAELGDWCIGDISPDVFEMDHVGGILCIRKGTIKDFGERPDYQKGLGDDQIIARSARQLGYKVGLARNLYFHHLGQGHSTVW